MKSGKIVPNVSGQGSAPQRFDLLDPSSMQTPEASGQRRQTQETTLNAYNQEFEDLTLMNSENMQLSYHGNQGTSR